MDLSWQDDAACRNADPAIFFPETKHTNIAAEKLCESCPVRLKCLVFAIENKIEHGIWGGHGLTARRRIKRRGKIVA